MIEVVRMMGMVVNITIGTLTREGAREVLGLVWGGCQGNVVGGFFNGDIE